MLKKVADLDDLQISGYKQKPGDSSLDSLK